MSRKVPKSERVASFFLLIVLVGLVLGVVIPHQRGYQHQKGSSSKESVRTFKLPSGVEFLEKWQHFPANRIYEKIDGKVTLYEQYGVVSLDAASVMLGKFSFDIYLYTMVDSDSAVGVYLAQSPERFEEISFGDMADSSSGLIRVIKGSVYLEVLSVDKNSDETAAKKIASSLVSDIKSSKKSTSSILDLLPKQNRVKGTLAINKDSAFGLASLKDTYSASYQIEGIPVDIFLKNVKPGQQKGFFDALSEEINSFDGKVIRRDDSLFEAELLGKTMVAAGQGDLVVGVHGDGEIGKLKSILEKIHGRGR